MLVNSAGILVSGPTETITLDKFDDCWNINGRAAFVLTQAALPHLLKSKGNIVHVSSVTGNSSMLYFKLTGAEQSKVLRYINVIF